MRILVIEDDLEAQRYLVQGLKESGHVVDEAADGETGLSLALSRPLVALNGFVNLKQLGIIGMNGQSLGNPG